MNKYLSLLIIAVAVSGCESIATNYNDDYHHCRTQTGSDPQQDGENPNQQAFHDCMLGKGWVSDRLSNSQPLR
ncbi:hypothetical protein [Carnimonas bestiolae]|uniref:hypothetical protein n=1 Tax=Carnimonas bestiolae TaxID=3402172 RepID=UPI003EDC78A5